MPADSHRKAEANHRRQIGSQELGTAPAGRGRLLVFIEVRPLGPEVAVRR